MATKTEDTDPKPAAAATSPAEPAIQAEPSTPEPPTGEQLARSTPATQVLAMQRAGTMQAVFAGLMPTSIGELVVLCGHLAKSEAIPKSMRGKPDTVFTVCWAGLELGLTPIRAVQSISNISGTLCMKADLQRGLVKNRGVMAFMDEGFERYGQTDSNLAKRMQLALRKLAEPDDVELVVEKIAAATAVGMKAGDPYGWAIGVRHGDPTIHVRTFTFADAEKAIIYEADEGNPSGPKEKKPLSQKFNYKSFPADMYPKRALTRLLQVVASDVTNGLPAVEAVEGGQIIDADFTVHHGADAVATDDVDTLLDELRAHDAAVAATVEAGFDQLKIGKAARLQKLTQFRGKSKDLVEWLKTEYANRKGVDRKRADVLGGDQPAEPAKPAAPSLSDLAAQAAAGVTQAGEIIDAEVTDEQLEADPGVQAALANIERAAAEMKAAAKPMTPARDLAARFKAGMKTF